MEREGSSKALHESVKTGNAAFVRFLLWTGVSVNARDECGQTALHVACQSKHKNMEVVIDVLLKFGAEVNARGKDGSTPLHEACANANHTALDQLIRNGANITLVDSKCKTPLHFAIDMVWERAAMTSVVATLLSHYSELRSEKLSHQYLAYLLEQETVRNVVNLQDHEGNTPLHLTCERNNKEVVCLLLRLGAKVGIMNETGKTALHTAGQFCAPDVINVLVDNGEDINAKDFYGNTPLHTACSNKLFNIPPGPSREIVEIMLNKGAKIFEKNVNLKTPYEMLNFHQHASKSSVEERTKIEESFIKHHVLQSTVDEKEELKIKWKLGPAFYDKTKSRCCLEIDKIRYTTFKTEISLYKILAHKNKPYFLSPDDLLHIANFLWSPNMLKIFPLYGHTLRTMFQRSNLLTLAVQSFYAERRKRMMKELPWEVTEQLLSYLTNEDLRNFIHSE